jgi:hydrophobe/amphiphile efflux-3 (HAE3) family protein
VSRIFRFVAQWPWLSLLFVLGVTVAAGWPLVDVQNLRLHPLAVDMSQENLLPEGDEARIFYDYVRKAFGSDESMVVAVSTDDVFTLETLSRIQRIVERIERLDGVHHVVAITNAANVRGSEEGIDIRPFVKEVPTDPAALDELRSQALENPLYAGNLISKDGKTAALVVQFLNISDREFIAKGLDDAIRTIAHGEAGSARVWITGGPHLRAAQAHYLRGNLLRIAPLILLALAVVLGFSFRTVRGVVLPLLSVSVSVLWTLGIMAWLELPLNLVTFFVPVMLLILGVAYSVHIVSEFYDTVRDDLQMNARDAVEHTMKMVWLPELLAGLTTMAGFLSYTVMGLEALFEFGWLMVTGVLVTMVVTVTMTPALLSVLGRPRKLAASEQVAEGSRFARVIGWLAAFDLRNRRAIFAVWAAVTLTAAGVASQLVVGSDGIKSTLPLDSEARLDFDAVNTHLDGANGFQIVIEAKDKATFKQPANLRELESLQNWLEAQPEIGGTRGLVDFVRLLNRAFHENDPTYLAVPTNERLSGQLLFLGASDELEGYIDARYQLTNIQVRTTIIGSALVSELVERIEARMAELPPHLHGRVTGNQILMAGVVDNLLQGELQSILTSLFLIYVLLSVLFLSFTRGIYTLVPNLIPVVVYFGMLAALGIPLSLTTAIIAPMALGISIDDTIHYFLRFSVEARRLANEERATVAVLKTVGKPAIFSASTLIGGFLMLCFSDLLSYQQVGALTAFTLGVGMLVEVTLTPALCGGLRIVTLWDTLGLDLGEDPQKAIPLFTGLSKPQCRIVAQMASLRELPAGTALGHIGDNEREMYVIIDGIVRIWKPGDAGEIELNRCARGEVVGEVGLFFGERSANMDVATDARLLRFTPNTLQRLARQRPRIAATILRNLNEILAQRLSRSTVRLTS